jgi:hypothetical protein
MGSSKKLALALAVVLACGSLAAAQSLTGTVW